MCLVKAWLIQSESLSIGISESHIRTMISRVASLGGTQTKTTSNFEICKAILTILLILNNVTCADFAIDKVYVVSEMSNIYWRIRIS